MGHEYGAEYDDETIEQIPVYCRFSGQKEDCYQHHIYEGKYIGKKKSPAEVNYTIIGHHKGVYPVVEHKSPQGQQKKGEKQALLIISSTPQKS